MKVLPYLAEDAFIFSVAAWPCTETVPPGKAANVEWRGLRPLRITPGSDSRSVAYRKSLRALAGC